MKLIDKEKLLNLLENRSYPLADDVIKEINNSPDITMTFGDNGTLWVTMDSVEKINRVVIDDENVWCKSFYPADNI